MPPSVSIIVPCYNEQATIRALLKAIIEQSYPLSDMEVVIVDGLSNDKTLAVISDFQREHPNLHVSVVPNPQRTIPSSLNLAITKAKGKFIIRLDAHSIPIPEYVQRCVDNLDEGKGECVGGIWEIRPGSNGWIARSIAAAASHPLGVGDAMYRLQGKAGPVDTVPFGAFRSSLINKIGVFDETLLTNEDYEFNTRIRLSGGVVWLDPDIRSTYVSRSSLFELIKQYWRYGYWKLRMLIRYPNTLRWRQGLPPVFVLSLICLCALSFFNNWFRILLGSEIILYLFILGIAGIFVAIRKREPLIAVGLLLAIMTMHISWGSGFLASLVQYPFKRHV